MDIDPIVEINRCMEIHIAIADIKASGITFGQDYNPTVYKDIIHETLTALREALTIAIDHGYTFPINDLDEDDEDTDDQNTNQNP